MNKRQLVFDPGAMSIIQMGQELIGHPSTALGELVKNAYDADAIECKIYAHPDTDSKKSFLVVADDGIGMSSEILFGEWLQPSISAKRKGTRKSKIFQRSYLGSKGIGRLAAMALGRHLTVISRAKSNESYNWLYLDRNNFHEDILLSKVVFPGGYFNNITEFLSDPELRNTKNKLCKNTYLIQVINHIVGKEFFEGTLIVLEGLDESISTIINDDYKDSALELNDSKIIKGLRSLVTPLSMIEESQQELLKHNIIDKVSYHRQNQDSFSVYFGTSLYDKSINEIKKTHLELIKPLNILKKYHYRILGKVNIGGEVTSRFYCQRLDNSKYNKLFKISSKDALADEIFRKRIKEGINEDIPDELLNADVGEFFFDIRIYDRDVDALDKLNIYLKMNGRLDTRRFLNEISGIRIAKNGFGIKPYGEEDKDWMGQGQLRVLDPSSVIGPTQLLGYIFLLSPQNDGLSEKTNREGLFENKAFINLKKIIRAILKYTGNERYAYRQKHNLGRNIKSLLKRPDVKTFMNYLTNTIGDDKLTNKANKFITDVNTTLDNMEYSLTFSQRLATLGSGLELIYHELKQPIHQLGGVQTSLKMNSNKILESFKKGFENNLKVFDSSLDVLEELKKSIEPSIGISKSKIFTPYETFNKVCRLFNKDVHDYNIKIEVSDDLVEFKIKDFEYALWVAFLNIINNAVYWLKRSDKKKTIQFKLEKKDNLVISNSGPNIEEEYIDEIFEYGVTFKPEKNATGLGLAYTRSILSKHDWEVYAENRKEGPAFIIYKSREEI